MRPERLMQPSPDSGAPNAPAASTPKRAARLRDKSRAFRNRLAEWPRGIKRLFLICFDFFVLAANVWIGFSFRYEHFFLPNLVDSALILAAPVIALPIFVRMGLYRSVLRYLPEKAIWTIIQAVTLTVLLWLAVVAFALLLGMSALPRTVPVIFWVLSVTTIVGSRFGTKWLLWTPRRQHDLSKQTLIYGTGDAGTQLANALRSTNERFVAGFISEDPKLYGLDILGIRVYPRSEIARVIGNFGIDEVVITTPNTSDAKHRELLTLLGTLPVKIRILPAIADLAAGKYLVSFVRDFDLDDLLGRSPVPADAKLLHEMIDGRAVLITGAAGSIGSALARLVARFKPSRLVLVDFNEHGLYEINRELSREADFPVVPVLGSVADAALVRRTLFEHNIQTVYHCAAYKHVSLVEGNRIEGIRNNVFGTAVLAEAAALSGVESFILISSDKAVRPTNVMGATKRWAELIVRHFGMQPAAEGRSRVFAAVRFGNVIGSSGSVVPLFKEQIASGGPVTLTDENMTRYFMSVREAAELIVQAGGLAASGDILLLEMGKPIRIRDLAEDMISLAGFSVRSEDNPGGDVEIVTIGAREGEKLHEELFYDASGVQPTSHPKILRAKRQSTGVPDIALMLEELGRQIASGDEAQLKNTLFRHVTG